MKESALVRPLVKYEQQQRVFTPPAARPGRCRPSSPACLCSGAAPCRRASRDRASRGAGSPARTSCSCACDCPVSLQLCWGGPQRQKHHKAKPWGGSCSAPSGWDIEGKPWDAPVHAGEAACVHERLLQRGQAQRQAGPEGVQREQQRLAGAHLLEAVSLQCKRHTYRSGQETPTQRHVGERNAKKG